jgi:hypothetical protein
MSLFVTLIAIFMAWLGASTIIELLHFGHWFQLIPSWAGLGFCGGDRRLAGRQITREHVTFADESERVEDMAIECPVSP